MRKSINKISSSVLAGALTCSVLFPAAEKVNISSAALLNMMAGVTKTAAGAAELTL